jgi:hypothetical protein
MKESIERMSTKNEEDMLEELIKKGESDTIEFKSSMRAIAKLDLAVMSIEESLEKAVGQDEKNTLQRKLIRIFISLVLVILITVEAVSMTKVW